MNLSNFIVNTLIDQLFRGQSAYTPANFYAGLLVAPAGIWAESTVYGAGSYMTVSASDGYFHLYYSAAGGTSAGSATSFPGVEGETITDNTVTWVEQSIVLEANGAAVHEVTIGVGSYARPSVPCTLTEWAGTQASGSTTPSTGTSDLTTNNVAVTWPSVTANWTTNPGVVWAIALFDAGTGGNLIGWAPVTVPTAVLNGAAGPSVPIGYFEFSLS